MGAAWERHGMCDLALNVPKIRQAPFTFEFTHR
jgi:hypothetical protein